MNTQRISAEQYLADKNNSTTIDLRTAAEVEFECIENCHALPVQELSQERLEQVLEVAKHTGGPIHLLCQSGRRAEMAVDKLKHCDNLELIIIEGGLNALKTAGAKITLGNRKVISLERQVRIAAGTLTVLGVVLGTFIHPGFYGMSAFVGAGLMFAGITDTCGMALMLARMPWNAASKA